MTSRWENSYQIRHTQILENRKIKERLINLTILKLEVEVLVTQSCPPLCDLMDCSPAGSSVRGILQARNTGVGCLSLLQGMFPTQGSNPGLQHCRRILYCLSHQGTSPGSSDCPTLSLLHFAAASAVWRHFLGSHSGLLTLHVSK